MNVIESIIARMREHVQEALNANAIPFSKIQAYVTANGWYTQDQAKLKGWVKANFPNATIDYDA